MINILEHITQYIRINEYEGLTFYTSPFNIECFPVTYAWVFSNPSIRWIEIAIFFAITSKRMQKLILLLGCGDGVKGCYNNITLLTLTLQTTL